MYKRALTGVSKENLYKIAGYYVLHEIQTRLNILKKQTCKLNQNNMVAQSVHRIFEQS